MSRTSEGLRILLTADAVGGVWTYAQDLASGLAAQGAQVVIALLGPAPLNTPDLPAGIDLIVTGLPLDWEDVQSAALKDAGRRLADLAAASGVDIVHLNSPVLAAGSPFDRPVVGGCHSCVATWWDAVRGDQPLPAEFVWRTEQLREGYDACNALIAPSQSFADQTRRRYGLEPQVVWNGRARPAQPSRETRRLVAVTTGRLWDEAKGGAALNAAAGRMRRPIQAAGPLRRPASSQDAVFAHLDLLGELDSVQVANLLSDSAVFVSAARYEPFGLSTLEAAQAGCALVLTDLPVFHELWDGAAVFVDTTDDALLAATLDALLADETETRRLGALARARADRFSLDAMVARTLAVYADAMTADACQREAAA